MMTALGRSRPFSCIYPGASAILVAPTPARRLPFKPAHGYQHCAAADRPYKKRQLPLCRRKHDSTRHQQDHEDGQNDPALPASRNAPSPAVALGREPVTWGSGRGGIGCGFQIPFPPIAYGFPRFSAKNRIGAGEGNVVRHATR